MQLGCGEDGVEDSVYGVRADLVDLDVLDLGQGGFEGVEFGEVEFGVDAVGDVLDVLAAEILELVELAEGESICVLNDHDGLDFLLNEVFGNVVEISVSLRDLLVDENGKGINVGSFGLFVEVGDAHGGEGREDLVKIKDGVHEGEQVTVLVVGFEDFGVVGHWAEKASKQRLILVLRLRGEDLEIQIPAILYSL